MAFLPNEDTRYYYYCYWKSHNFNGIPRVSSLPPPPHHHQDLLYCNNNNLMVVAWYICTCENVPLPFLLSTYFCDNMNSIPVSVNGTLRHWR